MTTSLRFCDGTKTSYVGSCLDASLSVIQRKEERKSDFVRTRHCRLTKRPRTLLTFRQVGLGVGVVGLDYEILDRPRP